jgi:predicted transport protein
MITEATYKILFFLILFTSLLSMIACCVWFRLNNYHAFRNYTQIVPVISRQASGRKIVLSIATNQNEDSPKQIGKDMTNICL